MKGSHTEIPQDGSAASFFVRGFGMTDLCGTFRGCGGSKPPPYNCTNKAHPGMTVLSVHKGFSAGVEPPPYNCTNKACPGMTGLGVSFI